MYRIAKLLNEKNSPYNIKNELMGDMHAEGQMTWRWARVLDDRYYTEFTAG